MGRQEDRKYIHSQAAEIGRQLSLAVQTISGALHMEKDQLARYLWREFGKPVLDRLEYYKDGRLTKIAVCGLSTSEDGIGTPLCLVEDVMDLRYTGRGLLQELAAVAITAALTDQLWDAIQKAKSEPAKPQLKPDELECPFCQWTTASSTWHVLPTIGELDKPQKLILHIGKEHEQEARGRAINEMTSDIRSQLGITPTPKRLMCD